jgi:formylglycine-generating enzyme
VEHTMSDPDTVAIRRYLTRGYDDTELVIFCADYFEAVRDRFTAGMMKPQMIQTLLDYCRGHDLTSDLLTALRRDRPDQFQQRFGALAIENPPESSQIQSSRNSESDQRVLPAQAIAPSPGPRSPLRDTLFIRWPSEDSDERLALEFIRIPAGEFLMGSDPRRDRHAGHEEQPQHLANLEYDFYISKYPVTVAQFRAFAEAKKYATTAELSGKAVAWTGSKWDQCVKEAQWRHPRGPLMDVEEKAGHPVTQVSWHDAVACCRWLKILLGKDIRLPTEAQWEKAARGVDGRIYPWGNASPDEVRCNFNKNIGDTTPVTGYPHGATPDYGVFDMAGNVYEWTHSPWSESYEEAGGPDNPAPADERRWVLRGGSWFDDGGLVRAAFRIGHHAAAAVENYGFRCVYIP